MTRGPRREGGGGATGPRAGSGPGRGHAHEGHDHHLPGSHGRTEVGRRLSWVLGITAVFMVAEVVGGLVSGSLALLADAGHMFTDVAALALSVIAIRLAKAPSSGRRTYGYVRLEILAALVNGATLLAISGWILFEAWARFRDPVEIRGGVMLVVAAAGFAVNAFGAAVLHAHAHDNLNVRGAYLHVLGDLLGSVGAILAACIVLVTGWSPADALVSALIALLILYSAWHLVRDATDVLMESVPRHIDIHEVMQALAGIEGLEDLHDMHVWTLTSGFVALSGHGVVDDPTAHNRILGEIRERMAAFGIEHVTFQLEQRALYQLPPR